MKKVILSVLLCFGVGLTLMGSPAQVPDDNNPQAVSKSSVTAVTVQPQNPAPKTNGRIKYELPGKVINPSKLSAPKMMVPSSPLFGRLEGKLRKIVIFIGVGVISDPLPPNWPGHGNGGGGSGRQSAFAKNPPLSDR